MWRSYPIVSLLVIIHRTHVNIICQNDWDVAHESGASINNICHFASLSPALYIKKGYVLCDWKDVELSEYFKAVYAYGKGSGKRAEYPIDKALSSITTEDLPLLGQGHPYYTALFNLVIPKNGKTGNQLKIEITDTASRQFTLDVTL